MSGYYNKDINHTVDINEVLNPPLVENFPSLTYEQIQTILDAPVNGGGQATYVKLGDFGEVLISTNLKKQLNEFLASDAATDEQLFGRGFNVSTIGDAVPGDAPKDGEKGTLRWPSDAIDTETDYVFFQFGKYIPPFSRDVNELREDGKIEALEKEGKTKQIRNYLRENSTTSATYEMYRNSEALDVSGRTDVMLPIPQDLSNEIQAQWQGKQFTATGRAATAALAAGNFAFANTVVSNIAGNAKALQTALNTAVLNSIPGVGGNLSFNDVSGSTRGIVINPNAELLYDSPEMREIGMIFKLVAQNEQESKDIRRICQLFRASSLPKWGGGGLQNDTSEDGTVVNIFSGESKIVGSNYTGIGSSDTADKRDFDKNFDVTSEDNWIRVPDLCKFTFMRGDRPHPYIPQFKPCAIQAVEVNYTPDGTYATYQGLDGAPVAVELRLNFMETKLIYANEISLDGGVGY